MPAAHRLVLDDVTVSYSGIPAIHHVSLETGCGQAVALVGPNGAGKSTLLKAMAGLLPLETGHILFHGHDAAKGETAFAYLPQRETVDRDFPITVQGLVETGRYAQLGALRPFGRRDKEAVQNALATVGMEAFAGRQIGALSGGQQQRVFLARALAQGAHVLLLDEPFAGLDQNARTQLGALLRQLAGQGHLVLAAYHDLNTVADYFDAALLLNGELVAFGPPAQALSRENINRAFGTPVFAGSGERL